jgi:hypothetical protein
MQGFVNLCTAAGIDVARLQPFDMFLIVGKLVDDTELFKRAVAMRDAKDSAVIDGEARLRALAAMTQAERAALRDRVLGVVQFKQS